MSVSALRLGLGNKVYSVSFNAEFGLGNKVYSVGINAEVRPRL